jgi:pyrimidine operon attenuation protein / uracil phosphoribosyltransferase
VQWRGGIFAELFYEKLNGILNTKNGEIPFGKIDPTFHRDDFRMHENPLSAYPTEVSFSIHNKRVLLIDDVLYTGRTVQAAIAALNTFGRPKSVELLCLADRRFNRSLPIRPNFVGITVDAVQEAYLKVEWQHAGAATDRLLFYEKKE